ncbi:MAG: T9SS type A sorting domain-containing protein [Ferruginibacter sp.]
MRTLDRIIRQWVLTNLKLICITCVAVLFAFTAKAQLPGQLPVNLKAFRAMAETNNKVKVFWTTEYEKDNSYFDIERSADGVNFTATGRVPGQNQHGILLDYYFYDYNAMKGISYYRLKQVDIDGNFSYSPIERVGYSATGNSVDVYPNPAPGREFKISLLKNIPGNIDVVVFDLNGRLQLQQQFSNSNTLTVNHSLPAGTYMVKINGKDFKEIKKLLIQ